MIGDSRSRNKSQSTGISYFPTERVSMIGVYTFERLTVTRSVGLLRQRQIDLYFDERLTTLINHLIFHCVIFYFLLFLP